MTGLGSHSNDRCQDASGGRGASGKGLLVVGVYEKAGR